VEISRVVSKLKEIISFDDTILSLLSVICIKGINWQQWKGYAYFCVSPSNSLCFRFKTTQRILIKFGMGIYIKICHITPNFSRIWQLPPLFYMTHTSNLSKTYNFVLVKKCNRNVETNFNDQGKFWNLCPLFGIVHVHACYTATDAVCPLIFSVSSYFPHPRFSRSLSSIAFYIPVTKFFLDLPSSGTSGEMQFCIIFTNLLQ